jgi:hypothetical protein
MKRSLQIDALGQTLTARISCTIFLCAASRPVSILPDSSSVSPGFQVCHLFAGHRIEIDPAHVIAHLPGDIGPVGEIRRGLQGRTAAVEHKVRMPRRGAVRNHRHRQGCRVGGVVLDLDVHTVVRPPRPCAPMPRRFTASMISRRSSSMRFAGRARAARGYRSGPSAIPWPAPRLSPPCRRCRSRACPEDTSRRPWSARSFTTQSTIESEGLSITSLDLFSEPPPLAATRTSTVSPGTSSMWITAGVLSPVFLRAPAGSLRIEARSTLSGCV